MATLLLFSFPFFRRLSYEIFLRLHQGLAVVFIYFTWRHLPSHSVFPRIYVYVPVGFLLLTALLETSLFLYRNGVFPSRSYPRASIICEKHDPSNEDYEDKEKPLKIRVALSRPLETKAGQYVNLWLPTVSLLSWTQTHPFMITSWGPGKQDALELFVQSHRGLTAKLRARAAWEGSVSYTAFVSGPYGHTESVNKYESVLVVASGFGIAGIIPYLKQLLYGYNTCTSRVRRVHFVWQVATIGKNASLSNYEIQRSLYHQTLLSPLSHC